MKTILIALTLLILSSCITRKACDRKFPLAAKDSMKEIIRTVTTYRDTTLFITVKGDTVFKELPVNVNEVNRLSTSLSMSEAWISNGKLKHRMVQKDTVIPATVKNALKTSVTASESVKVFYHERKVNELTQWQRIEIWIGRILTGLVLLLLLLKFIK